MSAENQVNTDLMYATIDTNILVSALLKQNSNPDKVVQYIRSGYITPLVHKTIIEEYRLVLTRDKFKFNQTKVFVLIQLIINKAIFIEPNHLVDLIDKTDEIFYSITMDESAPDNSFLITGNINIFHKI